MQLALTNTLSVFFFFKLQVSDSQTFGSGGTTGAAAVVNSSDSSCFNANQNVQPDFFYNLDPNNQIVQCTSSRIWWAPANVTGNPTFYGVIPGGDSFEIPFSNPTQKADEGTGFNWVPPVRGGTTFMLGAGDNRGLGSGGSVTYIVAAGNSDTSCLNSTSPSSTAGSPAGGSYPTSTQEAENGGTNSSGKTDTGAIVGGVIGGVVALLALVLVWLFFVRRRRVNRSRGGEKPDLFTDNERPDGEAPAGGYVQPEPYIVPPAHPAPSSEAESGTTAPGSRYGYGVGTGAGAAAATAGGRAGAGSRLSVFSEGQTEGGDSTYLHLETPHTSEAGTSAGASASAASRKGGAPPVLRPVNIIQHEDAGAPPERESNDAEGEEPETVELPPAYTNIRKDA